MRSWLKVLLGRHLNWCVSFMTLFATGVHIFGEADSWPGGVRPSSPGCPHCSGPPLSPFFLHLPAGYTLFILCAWYPLSPYLLCPLNFVRRQSKFPLGDQWEILRMEELASTILYVIDLPQNLKSAWLQNASPMFIKVLYFPEIFDIVAESERDKRCRSLRIIWSGYDEPRVAWSGWPPRWRPFASCWKSSWMMMRTCTTWISLHASKTSLSVMSHKSGIWLETLLEVRSSSLLLHHRQTLLAHYFQGLKSVVPRFRKHLL